MGTVDGSSRSETHGVRLPPFLHVDSLASRPFVKSDVVDWDMETRQCVVSPTEVADAASGSAECSGKRPSRPFGLWILTLALLGSPVIHAGALLLRTRWLNFGSLRLWDGLVYFLIAPFVGVLMLRRHERARFSAYVFLSCEVLRAVRIDSPILGLLAVGFLVHLQLPASRRFHPSIDPRRVLARLRLRRNGVGAG